MPFLDRHGVRIHYDVHGSASERVPLLLSHGFSSSGHMWEPNMTALGADRALVTWDMRGHARSDSPAERRQYGVDQSVEDMLMVLDVLGVERAALAGMSLGGYLSLAFSASYPIRVAALVLIDTGPGFRSDESRARWNERATRLADALERDGLQALPAGGEVAEHRDALGLAHTARRVMAQHDAHVIESLDRITVPTLVVVGALDTGFRAAADYMTARIPGARQVVLEGAGHAANIEAAGAFNAALRAFLEDL
jgi:pimeloyl-ACP methyl ester carboxylesterase